MAQTISCPRCSQPVDPKARQCPHCGVDLALAAALFEAQIGLVSEVSEKVRLAPEILVPRLGEYLVNKGALQAEGLKKALEHQEKQAQTGEPVLLGQALVELQLIDRSTLDQAVTEQILELQGALRRSNQQLGEHVRVRTAELESALERLSELSQLKANFIASVSHELRTPLAHMLGYLDLLGEKSLGPITEAQEEALKALQRAYFRLEGLIDNLLLFSMLSEGEFALVEASIPLQSLAKAVIAQSRIKAHERDISLKLDLPEAPIEVRADNEKIHWVLVQLLDNGIKFNHPGGKVKLAANTDGGKVTLAVEDTGIGIPQERMEELFEPFHQLDGSTTRRFGGTGMGLALVKRILSAHGSEIQVHSEIGKGTRVEFTLPVVEDRP